LELKLLLLLGLMLLALFHDSAEALHRTPCLTMLLLLLLQDHTLFKKKGRTECPPEAKCLNCMPKPGKEDDYECWAIKKPVMYKVCRCIF
jgi:hypothetical protein